MGCHAGRRMTAFDAQDGSYLRHGKAQNFGRPVCAVYRSPDCAFQCLLYNDLNQVRRRHEEIAP